MRPDAVTEQLMDRYFRQELSAEELEQLEYQLATSEELVDEMMLRRDIVIGIRAAERELLKKRLDRALHEAHIETGVLMRLNSYSISRKFVLALVALLVAWALVMGIMAVT